MIQSISLTNFLSYGGPTATGLELKPLNVVIGPNGSGKSNLIEALALLQSSPKALALPVREGGGVRDWLWRGEAGTPVAKVETVVSNPAGKMPLRYQFSFTEARQRFQLVDERIENEFPHPGESDTYFYYRYENNHPVLNVKGTRRELRREDVDPEQSILSQRKEPDQYPEITYLGEAFSRIRIFREWFFGRSNPARTPQRADLPNDFLNHDGSNLGLVLNNMRRSLLTKKKIIESLSALYDGIEDYEVIIEGGTTQVFLQEKAFLIPATRLSDGTLRYLCLLAILCHPTPPPLVCIEEPELGLHPDVIPSIARLLVEASERTQLIVTTHSDVLVDAMSEVPENVVVCEKAPSGSTLRRLDAKTLKPWLERYRLGELWTRGEIGGNRW
jgi:predicted ATPase